MELNLIVEPDLRTTVEALSDQVRILTQRVQELTERVEALRPKPDEDAVPEHVLQVIAAAVAAYLGKRATIRFVRPAAPDPESWSLQGRVAIQGSHVQKGVM
jgi:methylmalonyl-CoA carboxyltransferase large subunit